MMNWVSIFFFSIALIVCGSLFKKGGDILSPGRVFGLTWSIVFGLTNLKLSKLQSNWTSLEWTYVLMGPCSFLLGIFGTYAMNIGARLRSISEIRDTLREKRINESRLFYLIIIVFVSYLVGYVVIGLFMGPIPIFSHTPTIARTQFSIFGFGMLLHNPPIVVFFAVVYHVFVYGERTRKWILKAVVFVTIVTYLFLLQRYEFVMASVAAFTLVFYATRYVKLRTVTLFAAMISVVVYSISTVRAGRALQFALYIDSQMKFSPKYAIFTEPYMYLVMNLENFVHAVSKLEQHTFGYYTFNFALALTGIKHWIESYFGIVDTPYLFSGYNTYTLFWTFFRDFGLFGISFIPLALGCLVGSVYYTMRRNPTIEILSFYSIIIFVMGLSFFINLLGYLWFAYVIAWMFIILRLVRGLDKVNGK